VNNEELKAQARKTAPQIKIAAGLWVVGMMTIMAITITWLVISLAWAGDILVGIRVRFLQHSAEC
jgi:fatty acid desaturase